MKKESIAIENAERRMEMFEHLAELVGAYESAKVPANRRLLQAMIAEAAAAAGLPYQPETLDAGG